MGLRKVGLLGGSFDPVHRAHIALAEAAYTQLRLHEVQLIPAGEPWQRPTLNATPHQRLAMLELATADRPGLYINPVELDRPGKTYTVDTLEQLPADAEYYWILGGDQLANFCTWHRWQDVARLSRLVVAQRPDSAISTPAPLAELLETLGTPLIQLEFQPLDISGTEIRARLARGLPVNDVLDESVVLYIGQNQLYSPPPTTSPEL